MNLILQAIKALFRKVESAIPKSLSDLLHGEKIPGHMVEDMYYTIPGEYKVVYGEQTHEMAELNYDEHRYVNKNETTYGVDIPGWKSADHGITEDLLGKALTVIWDGTEYLCEAHDETRYEMLTLGNGSIVKAGNTAGAGEPFCILMDVWWGNEVQLHIRTNEPGTHTVAFGHKTPDRAVPINPKYIPPHSHSPGDIADIYDDGATVPVPLGGTGASDALNARRNLGIYYGVGLSTISANAITVNNVGAEISTPGAILFAYFPNGVPLTGSNILRLTAGGFTMNLYEPDGTEGITGNTISAGYHLFITGNGRIVMLM